MVVDASVAVAWFVPELRTDAAHLVLGSIGRLSVPDLLAIEFASVLTRKHRRRELAEDIVREAIRDFESVGIVFEPSAPLLADALALSLAERHPLYDCRYVALARRDGEQFATFDATLAALASRHGIAIWSPP